MDTENIEVIMTDAYLALIPTDLDQISYLHLELSINRKYFISKPLPESTLQRLRLILEQAKDQFGDLEEVQDAADTYASLDTTRSTRSAASILTVQPRFTIR